MACQNTSRPEFAPKTWLEAIGSMTDSACVFGLMWVSLVYVMSAIRKFRASLHAASQPLPTSQVDAARRDPPDPRDEQQRDVEGE